MLSRPNQRWLLSSSGFFFMGRVYYGAMNEMTRPAAAVAADRIDRVELSLAYLPLATPISDAKVLTGRQKPLTEVAFVFAEIASRDGLQGFGFGYSKRAGGPGMYAHAKEIAP